MVDAGPDEGQPKGDVDPVVDPEVFDGDKSLVVIEGNHQLKFIGVLSGAHKYSVGRPRA